MSETEPQRFVVYYDASCPMCRREISFYRRRRGADRIDWVDVSQAENAPQDLSCQQAMARFHVRRLDGHLVDGGAAFAELWKQLPAMKYLGTIFSVQPMRALANIMYNVLLPVRPLLQRLFGATDRGDKPRDLVQ